jgi:predicted MFS family arabinose efflux permease
MLAGVPAAAAAPAAGWLSDRIGKAPVLIGSNVAMAAAILGVARAPWGVPMLAGLAVLSIAASARQAPLHALTTEIVGPEIRGEFIAIRNAASQLGIALAASASAYAFDRWGFSGVSVLAAAASLLAPVCLVWLKPR